MTDRARQYHHGDLRAALLAEAAVMVGEGGAESLTMREIGKRLGVSRAAAYRHFSDKSALLVAVAAAGFDQLRARLEAMQAENPGADVEQFRRMGEAYVRFALDNPGYYRLMYGREQLTRSDAPPLADAADTLFDYLVEVVKTFQESGAIKKQNPESQAYVAWAAVHGLASLAIEGQTEIGAHIDDLIDQTTQTILDGMR